MVRSIAGLWSRMPCSAEPISGLREAEVGRRRWDSGNRGSHRIDMLDRKEPDTTLHCTAPVALGTCT